MPDPAGPEGIFHVFTVSADREYLDGTTASGLYEARLGAEEMGKENHIFSPAYREKSLRRFFLCADISC